MKAIFRRKSISDSSKSKSKSTNQTAPPPLPSNSGNDKRMTTSKSANTLPRNFNPSLSATNSNPTFSTNPTSTGNPETNRQESANKTTTNASSLPQVSLNRFSGLPLADFDIPLEDLIRDGKTSVASTPGREGGSANETFATPMSEAPPSASPKSINRTSTLESSPISREPSSGLPASNSPPRRSFDPATHPSKGRPDSLGPNSYFGSIGTPVENTNGTTSKTGSHFSELESPQIIPVRVAGNDPGSNGVQEDEERSARKKDPRSNGKNKHDEVNHHNRDRSASRSRKEKGSEMEKEKVHKRPSLKDLKAPHGTIERPKEFSRSSTNPNSVSKSNLIDQAHSKPQSQSQSQSQSHSHSQSQSQSSQSQPREEKKDDVLNGKSELKKSSSGFFSLMRRSTKRKSLINMKEDSNSGSMKSKSKSRGSIPISSSTPSLSSSSNSNSKNRSEEAPPLPHSSMLNVNSSKGDQNAPKATDHSSKSKTPPHLTTASENSTKVDRSENNPSTSHMDSSIESTDSSANNSNRERSVSGRSESRNGSSQGGGPETPVDGTPLIDMNGFQLPLGSDGKAKVRSHPGRSLTLDESSSHNDLNEIEINQRIKSAVQRTSSQVGNANQIGSRIGNPNGMGNQRQPMLPSLQTDGISHQSSQPTSAASSSIQPQITAIPQPRTPPNPNPSNPDRPSRDADLEQVRNSVAHSKNSSLDRHGNPSFEDEGNRNQIENERDAERPSSRFDMVIDAAAARNSLDANRQLGEAESEEQQDPKRPLDPTADQESGSQSPEVEAAPRASSQALQTANLEQNQLVNSNDINHSYSWFRRNSKPNLPPSFRSSTDYYRTVQETRKVMVPHKRRVKRNSNHPKNASGKQYEIEWREEVRTELVTYCDLFETIFSRTTEDVLERLVNGLDAAEIKTLRQTSTSLRFCLDNPKGREIVLRKFLGPLGYRSWNGGKFDRNTKDPLPISLNDLDAFMIGADLTPEYHLVGSVYSQSPQSLDPRIPALARASTRAYNKILSRLRLQPVFRIPSSSKPSTPKQRSPASSPQMQSGFRSSNGHQLANGNMGRVNSYYPQQGQQPLQYELGGSNHGHGLSPMSANPSQMPRLSPKSSFQNGSPSRSPLSSPGGNSPSSLLHSLPEESDAPALPPMPSPWKPGRSALFRVWVPAKEGLWLSDHELATAEQELFKSGVWNFLIKGDVIWDSAVGPLIPGSNVGKLLFDGRYLRDLSYAYDPIGHLPSWINSFLFSPSYFHNIIHSSGTHPVVFLDILPFREQVLQTLRLVQDHLETASPHGRYRVAKWLYRAQVTITGGKIISEEGLESVDEGWHGKLIIETDGTSEQARSLISRCAGPSADANTRAQILAAVTTGNHQSINQLPGHSNAYDESGEKIETTSPWCILRERSRPGLIWIRPIESHDRIR